MPKYPGVSLSVINRLPRYFRYLTELKKNGTERISSREFAQLIGFTASQIRQDLNCFGGFGQQGYGYNVASLHGEIGRILGVQEDRPAILIGIGNLGLALANHVYFERQGFRLIGIFDKDSDKIGKEVRDWVVQDISTLEDFCRKSQPDIAILCAPRESVVDLVDQLVNLGVKGFWNFSHYDIALKYGNKVAVENVHLRDSLMTLGFRVSELTSE